MFLRDKSGRKLKDKLSSSITILLWVTSRERSVSADFLGGREPKKSVSDEDSAALQNWVIRRLTKQMRLVKNPSIATRRDAALIAALCAAPGQRNASKMAGKLPQNRGPRSASVGHVYRGTMLRYFLALLACLERAAGPP